MRLGGLACRMTRFSPAREVPAARCEQVAKVIYMHTLVLRLCVPHAMCLCIGVEVMVRGLLGTLTLNCQTLTIMYHY